MSVNPNKLTKRGVRMLLSGALVCALGWTGAAAAADTSPPLIVNPDQRGIQWNSPRIDTADYGPVNPVWAFDGSAKDSVRFAAYAPALGADGSLYLANTLFTIAPADAIAAFSPDGRSAWDFALPASILSPPAVGGDGTVYVQTGSALRAYGDLYAIRPDGSLKWSASTGAVLAKPAFGPDGTVYVGGSDGSLYARRPEDGSVRWQAELGRFTQSYPAVGPDGTVYVGNDGDIFYAVKPDGSLKWAYPAGSAVPLEPAVGADGTIAFATAAKKLVALQASGAVKWTADLDGAPLSVAIAPDGSVVADADDDAVYAFAADGKLKWKRRLAAPASPLTVGADGAVCLTAANGTVQALSGADGSLQWRYALIAAPDYYTPPAVGPDGTVYASAAKLDAAKLESKMTVAALRVRVSGIAPDKAP